MYTCSRHVYVCATCVRRAYNNSSAYPTRVHACACQRRSRLLTSGTNGSPATR